MLRPARSLPYSGESHILALRDWHLRMWTSTPFRELPSNYRMTGVSLSLTNSAKQAGWRFKWRPPGVLANSSVASSQTICYRCHVFAVREKPRVWLEQSWSRFISAHWQCRLHSAIPGTSVWRQP